MRQLTISITDGNKEKVHFLILGRIKMSQVVVSHDRDAGEDIALHTADLGLSLGTT